jgi:hypothetical protein
MWDATYLYLGIDGQVSNNSWILYLDTDVGGANGQTNLTAIDTWERGATFTATAFKPDVQWGTYQHQGPFDSSSLFRLTSATTSSNLTAQAILAFDSQHTFGAESGSEIAIPWDVLYGLGPNACPAGAKIGVVASLCWDPEPNGELGGDVAPNNRSAVQPALDNFRYLSIDNDGNGVPDPNPVPTDVGPEETVAAAPRVSRLLPAVPNPFNPATELRYDVAGPGAPRAVLAIHDARGRWIATLADAPHAAGRYLGRWNGTDARGAAVASGIYFARLRVAGQPAHATRLVLLK